LRGRSGGDTDEQEKQCEQELVERSHGDTAGIKEVCVGKTCEGLL
jgi:hypothetical protein